MRPRGATVDQSSAGVGLLQLEPTHCRESAAAPSVQQNREPVDPHVPGRWLGSLEGVVRGVAQDSEDGSEDSRPVDELGDVWRIRIVAGACARACSRTIFVCKSFVSVVEPILVSRPFDVARRDCHSQVSAADTLWYFGPMVPQSYVRSVFSVDTSNSFIQLNYYSTAAYRRHG